MLYLNSFHFPTDEQEFDHILWIKRQCYDSFYPFKVLSAKQFHTIEFEPVTILYGGNGCGKTTALNIIAETLNLKREALYNRSNFFEQYIKLCEAEMATHIPEHSRIVTSDDVFDYMLNVRSINEKIDVKREELFDEYLESKYARFKMKSLDDYEQLKKINLSRRKTQSMFVRESLMDNVVEKSNGESAFRYFTENIQENALYLLDEPENSLSPERQMELLRFLEDSVRFFGCQFIISTHSPFLLSMRGAKIYDLDDDQVSVKKWTALKNVRLIHDFFEEHRHEF